MFGNLRAREEDERAAVVPVLFSPSPHAGNHFCHWVIPSLALTSYTPEKVSLTKNTAFFVCSRGVSTESPLKAPGCRALAREAIFFSAQDNDTNVEGENVVDMNSLGFWHLILSLLNGFSLYVSGRFLCLNI